MKKKYSKRTKKALLFIFIPAEIFFIIFTPAILSIDPTVGFIVISVLIFYALVIISIYESLKGKKPVIDLFREGSKTCRKCGYTYKKFNNYSCPVCRSKKKKREKLSFSEENRKIKSNGVTKHKLLWTIVGIITAFGEDKN